jgi:Ca2+-binding EF-hand superfamily protein
MKFRVTFEFIEKIRRTFAEADTDNTGYLDVHEFTAFMRRTYADISNREAEIIFMKVIVDPSEDDFLKRISLFFR